MHDIKNLLDQSQHRKASEESRRSFLRVVGVGSAGLFSVEDF
ncbi:hypothetical protein FHS68_003820 [Dyadobacter arcticus]|uniref:Twin-arginine translocation signal domain-containing protein n=1 Tax=Dyadobacter arcticus TaxID=1078754 RepID=A0ABX0UNR9_9BACT|nr:hypothetical protein [Dyadobacter arcticus]